MITSFQKNSTKHTHYRLSCIFVSIMLLGCSDYELKSIDYPEFPDVQPEEIIEERDPHIVVDPLSIDKDFICEPEIQEVSIVNVGEGPLHISSIELFAEGWYMTTPELPMVLEQQEIVKF